LKDEEPKVSAKAALALLQANEENEQAKSHLRQVAAFGALDARIEAVKAMGEWGDRQAFSFLVNELKDRGLQPAVRNTILVSLVKINPRESTPYLIDALRDVSSRETAAQSLGGLGPQITTPILDLLSDDLYTEGAIRTLEFLPRPPVQPVIEFAQVAVSRSAEYDALRRGINPQIKDEASHLLEDSLHEKSHQYGILALRAVGLISDRTAMNLAVENLQTHNAGNRANVIEALETISAKYKGILQPLMKLWEEDAPGGGGVNWERLFNDPDEWIRNCAAYAAHSLGVKEMENLATLSLMDRIIFFKRVPLFANLTPVDLKQVAALAEEETFGDGEEIAHEGEVGDVMFVIVSGEVMVCSHRNGVETEIARRKAGDYVGEMAIIGREPRMASLIAVGDVRTLCIDQKSFESLIRERPDVSLAVMRVLGQRLKEASLKK
jgi:CRP/FNR family transcriptional regulator